MPHRSLGSRPCPDYSPGCCQQTPLHRAVIRGEDELAALLVDAGANLEAGDHRGRTAADWAALKGHAALLQWLLDLGARPTRLPLRRPRLVRPSAPDCRTTTSGPAALGHWLDALGCGRAGAPAASAPLHAQLAWSVPLVLETGIKAIDLVAPFPRGGQVAIDCGLGCGHLLLFQQVAGNVIETYDARVVYVCSYTGDPEMQLLEWRSFAADGRLLGQNSALVLARQDEPGSYAHAAETGLSLAEDLRRTGQDVLLYVDSSVALADGVLPMLRSQTGYCPSAAITTCYLGQLPHGVVGGAFSFLGAVVRMDVRRAQAGRYPAVDLQLSTSCLLADRRLDPSHRAVHERARVCFRALGAHNLRAGGAPLVGMLGHLSPPDQTDAGKLLLRSRRIDAFLTSN